jgi:hypothetical protein
MPDSETQVTGPVRPALFLRLVLDRPERGQPGPNPLDQSRSSGVIAARRSSIVPVWLTSCRSRHLAGCRSLIVRLLRFRTRDEKLIGCHAKAAAASLPD